MGHLLPPRGRLRAWRCLACPPSTQLSPVPSHWLGMGVSTWSLSRTQTLGFRRAAPDYVYRGDCEDFLSFKVAQKLPGLLRRVCEQIHCVPSSLMRSFLSSEARAVDLPG